MRTVFFGTPQFSSQVLEFLLENGVDVVGVVTRPDKPKGRSGKLIPSPVKELALQNALPLFQERKVSSPEGISWLKSLSADLFVVVAYGEILKQAVLDLPPKGCINLHASLLPKFRGAAPIQRAIMEGEKKTGVSIMHMALKMDAGDVILTTEVAIEPNDTYGSLSQKLCDSGKKALLEVIHTFESGTISETPQDESLVTFAPKIELEECEVDWKNPASKLHDLIRGVNPAPGAWGWVNVNGKRMRLKFHDSAVTSGSATSGEILSTSKEGLVVACGENALLLRSVQLEGKKPMHPQDLLRGCQSFSFN